MNHNELVSIQREFFNQNATKSIQFRRAQLNKLYDAIKDYEWKLYDAFEKDLHKDHNEVYQTEIGFTLKSITDAKKNLRKMLRPKKTKTPLYLFPAKSYTVLEPYGVMLIIGPFNYPFQLVIEPLIGAIATGNTAVIKTSELAPHVSAVITEMIENTFPASYIKVIEGEVETTTSLLKQRFDYIFFTGSPRVGKIVMEAATKNLTPVTLELGGKSPVIITKSANVSNAAKKIAWGKLINTGQTCIAPDYLLIEESQKTDFIMYYQEAVTLFYDSTPATSPFYGRLVTEQHTKRLANLLEETKGNIVLGGTSDIKNRYLAPTLVDNIKWEDSLMAEEIFGPILPIITYNENNFDNEVILPIKQGEKPLALYLFSSDKSLEEKVFTQISFGGGIINDVLLHIGNTNLPFGGIGQSGIGQYHGEYSFEEFSHRKAIISKSQRFKTSELLYPPYTAMKVKLTKLFLK